MHAATGCHLNDIHQLPFFVLIGVKLQLPGGGGGGWRVLSLSRAQLCAFRMRFIFIELCKCEQLAAFNSHTHTHAYSCPSPLLSAPFAHRHTQIIYQSIAFRFELFLVSTLSCSSTRLIEISNYKCREQLELRYPPSPIRPPPLPLCPVSFSH